MNYLFIYKNSNKLIKKYELNPLYSKDKLLL